MDELLQLLNKIQEVFSIINAKSGSKLLPFDLPQIVVIGAQSCGKSSILESLVGRSFLPRGPGVVTRRPLILQLIYSSKKELTRVGHELSCSNLEAWGCFLHRPDRKYTRFDEMRQEIISETVRIAGEKQDISSEPIYLKIYSTSVNLTFIDLPGLIKMPVGDQPHDIEDKVRELVLHYISEPQSIILAVTPANTDITTSESLQLARQVDPKGIRTLAVITKLDLMDEGTDATDILSGRIISVRLGIYGVVNRSQRETQQGKAIAQALIDEASFFKIRYPKLAMHHGTPYLAKSLQHILIEQIRSFIPEIRSTIVSMSNHYKAILKSCGDPVFDKGQTILNIVTEYSTEFCSCIRGNSSDLDTSELCEGARISYIFQEMFGQTLDSLNPLAGFSKSKILTAMRNASGTCPALFIPETSFEVLVKRQIKTLEDPSIQCADLVYQELERVITNTARKCAKGLLRFTNLHRKILDISSDLIRSRLPDTHSTIRQLIEIQMAYINTNHPDFIKDAMYVSNWAHSTIIDDKHNLTPSDIYSENNIVNQSNHGPGFIKNTNLHQALSQASIPTSVDSVVEPVNHNLNRHDRENHDYIIIEELIKSYFHIVRKSIQDYVPKVIMHCLVNYVMDHIQQQLVTQLYQPDQFDDLLIESKQIFDKRKETSDTIKIFDKASEIINEIRDFHTLNANLRLW